MLYFCGASIIKTTDKMKKKIFYLATFLLTLSACDNQETVEPQQQNESQVTLTDSAASSNFITLEEARKDLENLLKDLTTINKMGGNFAHRNISNSFTLLSGNHSLKKSYNKDADTKIHIFNFEGDNGYAIMSATRDMPSLLAITENGNIDTNEVVEDPLLVLFLSNLEKKAKDPDVPYDPDRPYIPSAPVTPPKTKVKTSYGSYTHYLYNPVGGYCKVHWHQDDPYNRECPEKDGKKTCVGCVAVACAQLMSIYQYPNAYNGRTLNWSEMLRNNYSKDIAWLMRELGKPENLDMNYDLPENGGSGASPSKIPSTLKRFGFSNGGTLKSYNSDEVCSELSQHYPVLIGGFEYKISKSATEKIKVFGLECKTPQYAGGHRWLAHGLMKRSRKVTKLYYTGELSPNENSANIIKKEEYTQTSKYILCNFGWGYSNYTNGYYLSGIFDADKGGEFPESLTKSGRENYFQYNITAVTGIRK